MFIMFASFFASVRARHSHSTLNHEGYLSRLNELFPSDLAKVLLLQLRSSATELVRYTSVLKARGAETLTTV